MSYLGTLRFRRVCCTRRCLCGPYSDIEGSLKPLMARSFPVSSIYCVLSSYLRQAYTIGETGPNAPMVSLGASLFYLTVKYLQFRSDLPLASLWRRYWCHLISLLEGNIINDAPLLFFLIDINRSQSLVFTLS